jgi:type IV pilus assembly protein PilN
MIRINLLPHQRRGKDHKPNPFFVQLAVGCGVLLLTLAGCGIWGFTLTQQSADLQKEKLAQEQVLKKLRDRLNEIEQLAQKKVVLLADHHLLEKNQSRKLTPVILLDLVSQSLDPLILWLHRLSFDGSNVEIEGQALRGDDVGQFVANLEQTVLFKALQVIKTHSNNVQGLPVQNFTIRFSIKS